MSRASASRSRRRLSAPVARALLVAYLLIPAALVLGPLPVRLLDDTTDAVRDVVDALGGDPAGVSRITVEAVSNVVLFAPIGFLLGFAFPGEPARRLFLLCVGASVAIEVFQGVFLSGRHSSLRDILLNGAGAFIGLTAARGTRRHPRA